MPSGLGPCGRQLCSVDIANRSYSYKDIRLGAVVKDEKRKPQRLRFMHVERGDMPELKPKLPSMAKVLNSIRSSSVLSRLLALFDWSSLRFRLLSSWEKAVEQLERLGMKLPERSEMKAPQQSGSLRSNPLFGGSPPFRGGPRLPMKHKKLAPGAELPWP